MTIFVNQLTIPEMAKIITRIKYIFVIVMLPVLAGITSCEKHSYAPPSVDPNTPWSFSSDIQPIFNAKCTDASCHGGPTSPNLTPARSYQALTRGGYVSQPAENSRLYVQLIEDNQHKAITTPAEKLKILYWISQGAKNN
jgi:hypothetical protein